jgi:phosphoribosyl 1,2-cyclic phosphodiesterase
MLIDGGPAKEYERNTTFYSTTDNLFSLLTVLSGRAGPEVNRKLEYIDTVVLTHDDEDHKNGMFGFHYYEVVLHSIRNSARDCKSIQVFVSFFFP